MTPEEIKNQFGVDITTTKRQSLFVYLRSIYAQENKDKMHVSEIANNLKKDRTNIIHLIKSYDRQVKDPYFKLIFECYQNRDKEMLNKVDKFLALKRNEINDYNNLKIKKRRLSKPLERNQIKLKSLDPKIKRPHILEVAKNLRFIKTDLNDKIYTKWSEKDFNKYYKLIKDENNN